jgi:hypothetical protein
VCAATPRIKAKVVREKLVRQFRETHTHFLEGFHNEILDFGRLLGHRLGPDHPPKAVPKCHRHASFPSTGCESVLSSIFLPNNDAKNQQYLGRWYEYKKFFTYFQRDGKCVSATYRENKDGTIHVRNYMVNATCEI